MFAFLPNSEWVGNEGQIVEIGGTAMEDGSVKIITVESFYVRWAGVWCRPAPCRALRQPYPPLAEARVAERSKAI